MVSAEPGFTFDILRDVARAGEVMAAAEPQWEVDGKQQGYHAFTYGPLTNELLRRIDPQHRTMGQFFREEISEPFGKQSKCKLPPPPTRTHKGLHASSHFLGKGDNFSACLGMISQESPGKGVFQ